MRFIALHNKYNQWVADYILNAIVQFAPTENKPFVLGLPTGSTPLPVYRLLIEAYEAGRVSFAHVVTINMDEYVGLPPTHPQSYHHFMRENFFKYIDIDSANTHIPNGVASNPEAEAQRYETLIQQLGGVQLFFGGVGSDGHIAFNEPWSSLGSQTRVKTLTNQTIADNARFFKKIEDVPTTAITVGIQTIMRAQEVLILAKGQAKAQAVYQTVDGPISSTWPLSAFQLHKKFTLVCDEAAAGEVKLKTLSYFAQKAAKLQPDLQEDLIGHYPQRFIG